MFCEIHNGQSFQNSSKIKNLLIECVLPPQISVADDSELVGRLHQLLLNLVPVLHGVQEIGRELVHVQVLLKDVVKSGRKLDD